MIEVKIKTLKRFENLIGKRFGRLVVVNGPLNVQTANESKWKRRQRKWLCKCDCGNESIYVTNQLKKGSTKSCGCLSKDRLIQMNTRNCQPFEWIYNNMVRCSKQNKHDMLLSFEEFLQFTKQTQCHYCGDSIQWKERNSKKTPNGCYFLDRKDNSKGYIQNNCVVCCTLCNLTRHTRFTYDEMIILGKTIGQIKQQRLIVSNNQPSPVITNLV